MAGPQNSDVFSNVFSDRPDGSGYHTITSAMGETAAYGWTDYAAMAVFGAGLCAVLYYWWTSWGKDVDRYYQSMSDAPSKEAQGLIAKIPSRAQIAPFRTKK